MHCMKAVNKTEVGIDEREEGVWNNSSKVATVGRQEEEGEAREKDRE